MKKVIFISILAASLMTACGDKKASGSDADKAADSTASAKDTSEIVQPAEEVAPMAEEVEEIAFIDQIPTPKALISNLKAALKEKGFTGSSTGSSDEFNRRGKYSLESGDKSCIVAWEEDFSGGWNYFIRVTINGDAEALKQFYNRAKKLERTEIEGGTSVTLQGNMVEILQFGC